MLNEDVQLCSITAITLRKHDREGNQFLLFGGRNLQVCLPGFSVCLFVFLFFQISKVNTNGFILFSYRLLKSHKEINNVFGLHETILKL